MFNWIKNKMNQRLYEKSLKLFENKNYEEARIKFQELSIVYPGWEIPIEYIGFCLYWEGDKEKSIEYMDKSIELNPKRLHALYNKVIFLNEIGKKEESLKYAEELVGKENTNINYLNYYAHLLSEFGRYEDSIITYKKVLTLTSTIAMTESNSTDGMTCLDSNFKSSENTDALNNLGFIRLKVGRYEEAINNFNSVIEIDSKYAYSFNNRGFAYLKLGEMKKSLSDINHSISLDNKNSYAFKNKGLYYLEIKNKEEALKNLLIAKELGYKDKYGDEVDELIKKINKNSD